ncbi:TIR domain-containing protein [candidate division KSB1 bacterium]|nr:TIR domain-containing protein [candidate division KSB1 bacterium]
MSDYDVFLSYSRQDSSVVNEIMTALKEKNLSFWVDKESINWGTKFGEEIAYALSKSQFIIFCISNSYLQSNWCLEELNIAVSVSNDSDRKIHLLPLLLPDVDPKLVFERIPIIRGRQIRNYKDAQDIASAILKLKQNTNLVSEKKPSYEKIQEKSIESLKSINSWLDETRKSEIVELLQNSIPRLVEHRQDHIKRLTKRWEKYAILKDRDTPAWIRISPTQSESGNRLIIGFKNRPCIYRSTEPLKLGCFNCGFYAGAGPAEKATMAQLIEQFRSGLAYGFQSGRHFDVIEFLCDGSFFNDSEFDDQAKDRIFSQIAMMSYVKRVLVESTPEFIYDQNSEVAERLRILRNDQQLEIGIGLETADDFIRKVCINKGFDSSHFEKAIQKISKLNEEHKNRCIVVTYILVKPAFLKPTEVIKDVLNTLAYLNRLSDQYHVKIIPKLEPAAISDGTMLSLLYNEEDEKCHYLTLNYWAILEILTRAYLDKNCDKVYPSIRIGAREDMDDVIKVPGIYRDDGRLDQFDFILYDAVQSYNRHHDLNALYAMIERTYPDDSLPQLMSQRSSLGRWIASEIEPFNEKSEILTYFRKNNETFSESIKVEQRFEAEFLKSICQGLDIIEGYDYISSPEIILKIKQTVFKELQSANTPEENNTDLKTLNYGDITLPLSSEQKSQLNKLLFKCFCNQNLRLFDVQVLDVSLDFKGFLKMFFETTDFISGKSFSLWALIPTRKSLWHK